MNYAAARRAFSTIVDVARSRNSLMDHLRSGDDWDTVTIWGAEEGDLRLIDLGSREHPDYELEWETGTMPRAIAPGEAAPESSRHALSMMTTAQMIEAVFGERISPRSRREAAIELWRSILSEGTGLFAAGPVDEKLLRALIRNQHDIRGKLFVKEIAEAEDYRVIWSRSLDARTRVPDSDQTDLTDISVVDAVETILTAK